MSDGGDQGAAIGFAGLEDLLPQNPAFDRLCALEMAARELDHQIRSYAGSGLFLAAWFGWYESFKRYYVRRSPAPSLVVDAEVEGYSLDLERWFEGFQAELQRSAREESSRIGAPAPREREPERRSLLSRVPWWFWMLSGAAAVGGAYYAVKRAAKHVPKLGSYARDAFRGSPPSPELTSTEAIDAIAPFVAVDASQVAPSSYIPLPAPAAPSLPYHHAIPRLPQ